MPVEKNKEWTSRTELLLGAARLERFANTHVLLVGLGGVGAYAAEVMARAGIGAFTLVDADRINASNINRQLPATHSTIGQYKADVVAAHLKDINPEVQLTVLKEFVEESRIIELLDQNQYDFLVDAIDSLTPKCDLLFHAYSRNLPLISSMGAGAKSNPNLVKTGDLFKTVSCQLAKNVRKRLKRKGITKHVPVVFTTELADKSTIIRFSAEKNKESTVGTVSFMPALFGCHLGAYVINQLGILKGSTSFESTAF